VHFLPCLLRVLKPGGTIGMSTPALRNDPHVQKPLAQVTALAGWEAAAWHTPEWWRKHWDLTGMLTNVTAQLQPGSRDDWILWARASGDAGGQLLAMLTSMAADEIGFALVSAVKA